MNPQSIGNLSNQKRLLQSASAYRVARTVVNVTFILIAITGMISGREWFLNFTSVLSFAGPGMPPGSAAKFKLYLAAAALAYLFVLFVSWAVCHAFFDIADATLAISLHGPECQDRAPLPTPPPTQPTTRQPWPEPPKPLIPTPQQPDSADAKYLPKS